MTTALHLLVKAEVAWVSGHLLYPVLKTLVKIWICFSNYCIKTCPGILHENFEFWPRLSSWLFWPLFTFPSSHLYCTHSGLWLDCQCMQSWCQVVNPSTFILLVLQQCLNFTFLGFLILRMRKPRLSKVTIPSYESRGNLSYSTLLK